MYRIISSKRLRELEDKNSNLYNENYWLRDDLKDQRRYKTEQMDQLKKLYEENARLKETIVSLKKDNRALKKQLQGANEKGDCE